MPIVQNPSKSNDYVDYESGDLWQAFINVGQGHMLPRYKPSSNIYLNYSINGRDREALRDHHFSRVHDSAQHDTHQFMYDQPVLFDKRILFMITPILLLFVLAWLAFDWVGYISFIYQRVEI